MALSDPTRQSTIHPQSYNIWDKNNSVPEYIAAPFLLKTTGPTEDGFDMGQMRSMAQLSQAAHNGDKQGDPELNGQIHLSGSNESPIEYTRVISGKSSAIVAYQDGKTYVTFDASHGAGDWTNNANAFRSKPRVERGDRPKEKIHLGFNRSLHSSNHHEDSLYDEVKTALKKYSEQSQAEGHATMDIGFTGFSRGGAIAQIAMVDMLHEDFAKSINAEITEIYTFNNPKPGNNRWKNAANTLIEENGITAWNVQDRNDPVHQLGILHGRRPGHSALLDGTDLYLNPSQDFQRFIELDAPHNTAFSETRGSIVSNHTSIDNTLSGLMDCTLYYGEAQQQIETDTAKWMDVAEQDAIFHSGHRGGWEQNYINDHEKTLSNAVRTMIEKHPESHSSNMCFSDDAILALRNGTADEALIALVRQQTLRDDILNPAASIFANSTQGQEALSLLANAGVTAATPDNAIKSDSSHGLSDKLQLPKDPKEVG